MGPTTDYERKIHKYELISDLPKVGHRFKNYGG